MTNEIRTSLKNSLLRANVSSKPEAPAGHARRAVTGKKPLPRFRSAIAITFAALFSFQAEALDLAQHGKIQALVDELVSDHQYDRGQLEQLFGRVELQPRVIELIKRPAERLSWDRYRKIFISDTRINGGVKFWRENKAVLQRAETKYGVPTAVIVAIIGVETGYGSNMGSFPVIGSLTTLSLQYPRRSKFFSSELKKFLLLVREEQLDPLSTKGSYSGAIGIPQFMPSSYRAYAVDFSKDGRRDLVGNSQDAIGSVANYLAQHKWAEGGPIVDDVKYTGPAVPQFQSKEYSPKSTLADMQKVGVRVNGGHVGNTRASLVNLADNEEDPLYRAVFHNFYVITKYNRSLWYAMAVYELSRDVAIRFNSG